MHIQLAAKVFNGVEGELTRIYVYCECGKELASIPVDTLVRVLRGEPWTTYAQCVRCRQPVLSPLRQ